MLITEISSIVEWFKNVYKCKMCSVFILYITLK